MTVCGGHGIIPTTPSDKQETDHDMCIVQDLDYGDGKVLPSACEAFETRARIERMMMSFKNRRSTGKC